MSNVRENKRSVKGTEIKAAENVRYSSEAKRRGDDEEETDDQALEFPIKPDEETGERASATNKRTRGRTGQ